MKEQINGLIFRVFADTDEIVFENFLQKEIIFQKIEKILKFIDFLKNENEKINLISRKCDDNEIINKHILSSLIFVKHIYKLQIQKDKKINKIVDIGSGAGFPAIICAIFFPKIYFALVDSVQKKINFLYDTSKILDLQNIECFWGRVENFRKKASFMRTFDICTARALGTIELTTEYAIPLLKINGVFMTIKSFNQKKEFENAFNFIKKIGHNYNLYEEETAKSFIIYVNRIIEFKTNKSLKKI
jgi:16S rRNA (guanine527-N7)-methyltransferase